MQHIDRRKFLGLLGKGASMLPALPSIASLATVQGASHSLEMVLAKALPYLSSIVETTDSLQMLNLSVSSLLNKGHGISQEALEHRIADDVVELLRYGQRNTLSSLESGLVLEGRSISPSATALEFERLVKQYYAENEEDPFEHRYVEGGQTLRYAQHVLMAKIENSPEFLDYAIGYVESGSWSGDKDRSFPAVAASRALLWSAVTQDSILQSIRQKLEDQSVHFSDLSRRFLRSFLDSEDPRELLDDPDFVLRAQFMGFMRSLHFKHEFITSKYQKGYDASFDALMRERKAMKIEVPQEYSELVKVHYQTRMGSKRKRTALDDPLSFIKIAKTSKWRLRTDSVGALVKVGRGKEMLFSKILFPKRKSSWSATFLPLENGAK